MVVINNNSYMISVVIINHNGKRWYKNCLESVFRQTYKNFEVILIDNASTDDSISLIKKSFPKVRIIENKFNIGYGRANNLGVKNAHGELILFLNDDTVLENNTLEKLILCQAQKKLNILGPIILDYSGKDIHRGKKLSIDVTGYIGYGRRSLYVDGCALMIRKKDFLRLGGFDESYFIYSEEIDLCWRAHLYGMKVETCNNTSIKHFCGGTVGSTLYNKGKKHNIPLFRRYQVEKNNLRNVLKNYSSVNLIWIIPLFEIQSLFESLLYLLTGNISACGVIWKAHLWNIKNIRNTLFQRKIIQKNRVASDVKILSIMSFGLNKLNALITIGIPEFR